MNKRICTRLLAGVIVVLVTLPAWAQPDDLKKAVLAHFRFDGKATDVSGNKHVAELKNTEFRDMALYLNGKYDLEDRAQGFTARFRTPRLNYDSFTVALRFRAEDFGGTKWHNLITAGPTHRWFSLHRTLNTGFLAVTLNGSQRFTHEIKSVKLEKGKWTVVACAVDIKAGQLVVFVDGKEAETISLPAGFTLPVATGNAKETQKVWTFTNSGNATVFFGQVSELIIYNRALTATELGSVPLQP